MYRQPLPTFLTLVTVSISIKKKKKKDNKNSQHLYTFLSEESKFLRRITF